MQTSHVLQHYRYLALSALWIGLLITAGIFFAFVPNIELVTSIAFLAGYSLGARRGFLVAAGGEALFSAMNPIGSGLAFPILFLLQIISIGFSGLAGGVFSKYSDVHGYGFFSMILLGGTGAMLTLTYDFLTALSLPLSTGVSEGTLISTALAGMPFFILHITSNTLLFALFMPGLLQLTRDQLLMHGFITQSD